MVKKIDEMDHDQKEMRWNINTEADNVTRVKMGLDGGVMTWWK